MLPIHQSLFEKAYELHRREDFVRAAGIYRHLIEEGTFTPDLFHLYGLALHQLGDNKTARPIIEKAVSLTPQSILYRQNLAIVYTALGSVEKAVLQYRKILEINPDHLESHQNLVFHLRNLRRHEEALRHGGRAVELEPNHGVTWNNLGNVCNDLGRIEEARQHYRKSVELSPLYGQAWANLATVTKYTEKDFGEISKMESLLDSAKLSPPSRGQLCFAIGKAYRDLGQPSKSFPYYEMANRSVTSDFPWDRFESYLGKIREVFSGDFFSQSKTSGSEASPIFIVGMLRSGTSLIEQILATHSRISGVGERPELARLTERIPDFPRGIRNLDNSHLAELADQYRKAILGFQEPGTRSADKMMTNFIHIGFIAQLFPKAKIIHMKRNPYAVGLSIYFQNFAHPPGWSASLDNIGRYYANYGKMMSHWDLHSPVEIHTVNYEELLANPEQVTRDMFQYCGETREPDCLQFHRNRGVVQTASNWQVRQPLDQKNGEKWREYQAFLGDLEKWVEGEGHPLSL